MTQLYTGTLVSLMVAAFVWKVNASDVVPYDDIQVALSILDDDEQPIIHATISRDDQEITDIVKNDGVYTIAVSVDEVYTISAEGFETRHLTGQDILDDQVVEMNPVDPESPFEDLVSLPYMSVQKRYTTGSYNVIKQDALSHSGSSDMRMAILGHAPGLQITEKHGAPSIHPAEGRGLYGLSEKVTIGARGRNLAYVLDGMPIDISEVPVDPAEIESITVIKDIVGKTMYGPLGADGIMYIKTKRGSSNSSELNVNVETGIRSIDRFPEWVPGADYARLNNQAREADGITPLYSATDIAAYEQNNPYDMRYPSVDYRDYMLKQNRGFQNFNVSARGGGENAQYFSFLSFKREDDIFAIGNKSDNNLINLRSNVDISINDFISVELDINGSYGIRRTPGFGYTTTEGQALMGGYEFDVALPYLISTPPIEFPIYVNRDPELSLPWYGMTSRFSNPVGNFLGSGSYTEQNRHAGVNMAIDYDLSRILEGLHSRSSFGFDGLNLIRIGQANRYEGYRIAIADSDTSYTRLQSGISDDNRRRLHDYYYIRTVFNQSLTYQKQIDNHEFKTSANFFLFRKVSDNIRDPEPQISGIWTGRYTLNGKYTLQGVLNYAHTYSFLKENRSKVFPSAGFSWLLSEEEFMGGTDFVDFLKFRAEIGVLGFDPYLNPHLVRSQFTSTTRSSFGSHPLNRWFGSDVEASPPSTYPSWVGNPGLSWEERKEFNVGLEGQLFNQKLIFELNYFNTQREGIIGRQTNSLPYVTGMTSALPYVNHNHYKYYGIETGLKFKQSVGQVELVIGGDLTYQNSTILKYDEPNYRYDYQFRTGQPTDTYWGLNYIGRFGSDEETMIVPQLFDPQLHQGDLKYEDLNNDGAVDEDDFTAIGNTIPRIFYALTANARLGQFELYVVGSGAGAFDIPMTSRYFQNGWGDNNYSTFVRDNIDGDYPRLTYERVNNNFQRSNFWLTKGDYFKIKSVEFSYTIRGDKFQMINSNGLRLFARGFNLLTISSVKEIDPEAPLSGINSYPLNKSFTAGLSLTF